MMYKWEYVLFSHIICIYYLFPNGQKDRSNRYYYRKKEEFV